MPVPVPVPVPVIVIVPVFDKDNERDAVPVADPVLAAVLLGVCVDVATPVPDPDTVVVPDTEDVCMLVLV